MALALSASPATPGRSAVVNTAKNGRCAGAAPAGVTPAPTSARPRAYEKVCGFSLKIGSSVGSVGLPSTRLAT